MPLMWLSWKKSLYIFHLNQIPLSCFIIHLGNTDRWHLFYGPGAFVGVRDRGAENDIVGLGISGTAGISVVAGPIEFYGRVTPRLELIERTNVDIGGGLGIRAFF